jgi:hypothetical protein
MTTVDGDHSEAASFDDLLKQRNPFSHMNTTKNLRSIMLNGKTIHITGGSRSFGNTFAEWHRRNFGEHIDVKVACPLFL